MVFTNSGVELKKWRVAFTSSGVVFTNRRVEKLSRRVEKLCRRLVKTISRQLWCCCSSCAHIHILSYTGAYSSDQATRSSRAYIRILFPEKSLHLFTHGSFLPQIQLFKVWRLGFSSIHTGSVVDFSWLPQSLPDLGLPSVFKYLLLKNLWKVDFASLHPVKPMIINWLTTKSRFRCEHLKIQSFTP